MTNTREYALTRIEAAQLGSWASSRDAENLLTAGQTRVVLLRYAPSGAIRRTLAEVGRDLGVSRERVRQLEAKAYQNFRGWDRKRRIAQALESGVKELRITRLVRKALTTAGITRVRQLTTMSRQDLVAKLGYPVGRRASWQIKGALQEIGLDLAPSPYAYREVESLPLSRQALALLDVLGLHSLGALADMSRADLLAALERTSQQVIAEVQEALHERGLSLKGKRGKDSLGALTPVESPQLPQSGHGGLTPVESPQLPQRGHGGLTPVESLDLPQRAYGALRRAGYSTVEEVEELSDEELLRVHQFGVTSLAAVRHAITLFREGTWE